MRPDIWNLDLRQDVVISHGKKQPPEVLCKNRGVLKIFEIFLGKHLCWRLQLGLQLYQTETPAQVLFCEYSEIFKSTYFE